MTLTESLCFTTSPTSFPENNSPQGSNTSGRKAESWKLTDKSRRSLSQNAYLHAILGVLALETGNSLEVVKREIYKKKINPDLFVRVKHDPLLGEIEEVRSSRDLTKEEMSL